jgi:hypothetical protein
MSQVAPGGSGIQVTTGFRPLAFVLSLCRTRLVLDGGGPVLRPWGQTFIPVAPGRHTVRCWFRYTFFTYAGDSTVTVDVGPGQVVSIGYRAPMFMFSPGKWKVGSPQTSQAVQPFPPGGTVQPGGQWLAGAGSAGDASWSSDPSGRHQFRYWDGRSWTAHVSDNGVVAVDPV